MRRFYSIKTAHDFVRQFVVLAAADAVNEQIGERAGRLAA